jgi:hypothetical protein
MLKPFLAEKYEKNSGIFRSGCKALKTIHKNKMTYKAIFKTKSTFFYDSVNCLCRILLDAEEYHTQFLGPK